MPAASKTILRLMICAWIETSSAEPGSSLTILSPIGFRLRSRDAESRVQKIIAIWVRSCQLAPNWGRTAL
jgi:hypothetical protein